MRTPSGAGSYRLWPESRQTISYRSGARAAAAAPLPAFGVRVRTVGDLFRCGQFTGKAAAGVPGKTSNEIEGLLRAYPVMIHYA
jgi:hypothetical protein